MLNSFEERNRRQRLCDAAVSEREIQLYEGQGHGGSRHVMFTLRW